MANPLVAGPALIAAAQNPEQLAALAAQRGLAPPATGAPTDLAAQASGDLGSYLEPKPQSPFAGVKAPAGPAPTPFPGAPGAPHPSQAITPAATLVELLLNQQKVPQQPTLGSLIGR